MRILSVHNYYQQPGGEDEVFAAEARLLGDYGHQVRQYTRSNAEIGRGGRWEAGLGAVWNRRSCDELRALIGAGRYAVCHFHNFFPLVSPAAYRAARAGKARVVQTLHNYRLLCPAASFYRAGAVCESCLGRRAPWDGVWRGCYRESRLASGSVAAMISIHRAIGTWRREVDCYIALTEFARRKFIAGGLPAARIAVKPNFVHTDPGAGDGSGGYLLFVGRLSAEKDARTLVRAAALLGGRVRVKIAGDGPERAPLMEMAAGLEQVEFPGRQPKDRVLALMKGAAALVIPSAWYEGFPMVAAEAFATGLPVVASRIGSLEEIVDDTRTGLLFETGDASDLAAKIDLLLSNSVKLAEMRGQCRREYQEKYSAEVNYRMLAGIYESALEGRGGTC